mgnify:FL=1
MQDQNYDFFKYRKVTSGLSIALVVMSALFFGVLGLNYGIDFKGGSMIMVKDNKTAVVGDYRGLLNSMNLGDFNITEVFDPARPLGNSSEKTFLIRIEQSEGDPAAQSKVISNVRELINKKFNEAVFLQADSVGAKVSGELVQQGIISIVLAVCAVLIYVWLRFEWQFAIGAIAALIHDVLITIGIFSVLRLEFNLAIIAALLTIIGYSLNDTVVVFDRVRENLRKNSKSLLEVILNNSVNETLSRTIRTSVTTLLALTALFIFGGDVLRGFVSALIIGVVVGSYSSVFIASRILLILGVKRDWSNVGSKAGTQFSNIDA